MIENNTLPEIKECEHTEFHADVKVDRITKEEGGKPYSFAFECTVRCRQCGKPFEFIGVPAGLSYKFPTASVDFTELRVPIRPATGAVAAKASFEVKPPETETKSSN